jgi:hypothetical protein
VLSKSGAGLGLHLSASPTSHPGRSGKARTSSHRSADSHGAKSGTGTGTGTGAGSSSPSPTANPSHPQQAEPAPTRHRHHHHHHKAAHAVYANPLRDIAGLVPERIDQGVDFSGAGPVYPLGDAVITNASGDNYGWPDGGWITYRLTDGPGAGLTVFIAEDVRPTVAVGQTVNSNTVIANMFQGNAGIETGWAMASGFTAESQLPEAGGISGAGPFPTDVGLNFDELLQALGVPAANNRYDYPYGILPSSYPGDWATALGTH